MPAAAWGKEWIVHTQPAGTGEKALGYLAQYASGQLLTVMAFGAIVVMSALGVALFYAIAWLYKEEGNFSGWQR